MVALGVACHDDDRRRELRAGVELRVNGFRASLELRIKGLGYI